MKLNRRNLIIWVAGLLAIVAFCLMFAATLNATVKYGGAEHTVKILNVVLGATKESIDGTKGNLLYPLEATKYATCGLSLAGYIMVLVGGLAAIVTPLAVKNKGTQRLVLVLAALLLLVGAIFVLVQKSSFVNSETSKLISEKNITDEYLKKYEHDQVVTLFKDFKMGAAGIIAGILGILSSLGLVAAQFVRED